MRRNNSKRVLIKTTALLLIFAIAGLSTLAKQSRYLPESNPTHFLSNAAKMDEPHQPIHFAPAVLRPVAKIAPPQSEFRTRFVLDSEKPDLPEIGLVVSLQHRSPPSFLA